MARLTVVDASVLIAWLDAADPHHADAIRTLTHVDRFVVHPLTLAEVLVHPVRLGLEGDVVARLGAIGMIVSSLPIDPVALARIRAESGLKMPDCVVVACARAHLADISTFDSRLGRYANAL